MTLSEPGFSRPADGSRPVLWPPKARFDLDVTAFRRGTGVGTKADPASEIGRFVMHVFVLADEGDCGKLLFAAGRGAPASLGPNYFIRVNRKSGWPDELVRNDVSICPPLQAHGGGTFLPVALPGFPLELFPLGGVADPPKGAKEGRFGVVRRREGGKTIVEQFYETLSGERVRVRQSWADGDPWWGDYERRVDGRVDLRATWKRPPPPLVEQVRKGARRSPIPAEQRLLGLDRSLSALVTVVGEDPDLAEILRRLEDATTLKFSVDPGLAAHSPRFGSVQFRNVPAWTVMSMVARTQLRGGRWERVSAGYRLVGDSTAQAQRDRVPAPQATTGPHLNSWLILTAASLGTLALVLSGVRWYRRRGLTKG